MARLVIDHLGPIHGLELDVKQFNILIGEQATGKSIICKSVYFFREIKRILVDYLYESASDKFNKDGFQKVVDKAIKDMFNQLFGYSWGQTENFGMTYYYQDDIFLQIFLERKDADKNISLQYSDELKKRILDIESRVHLDNETMKGYREENSSSFALSEKRRLHNRIEKDISELFDDDMATYYIPAGRSLMTLLSNQKTRLDYDRIDLVNRRFMQHIESIQLVFNMGVSKTYKYYDQKEKSYDVHEMSERIINALKGEYIFSEGQEYLQLPDQQEKIPINYASSGQQEALWLLNQLYVLLLRNERAFVIVEEPEAHVYPTLQREILEFIVQFMNFTGSTVFVTTHSPYILTCANGLYYGGSLLKKNPRLQKRVEAILGEGTYIKSDNMTGFKLKNAGQTTVVQSLIDEELDQMAPELIDEVSDAINEQYTSLYYLEDEAENEDTAEG